MRGVERYVWSALHSRGAHLKPPGPLLGLALDHAARADWIGAHNILQHALRVPAERRAAHYLLWEVCQVLAHPGIGIANLQAALEPDPITSRPSAEPRRRVLAVAVPGDFQANLPLGPLLHPDDTELHTLWLADPDSVLDNPASAFAGRPPAFDCVFIAIAEDVRHARALQAADRLAAALGVPSINCGRRIAAASRVQAAAALQGIPHAFVPQQHLATRAELETGEPPGAASGFPAIIRPSDSHAGRDLARLCSAAELHDYLQRVAGERFYVAPFADYRSGDGLWRKYRIIFVDGRPYPYHLAIHDDWGIWYYNAKMEADPRKRAEEARFVADIGSAFPEEAMAALHAIAERVGLDYFGLDCGLMPDGRLVVFEVETGMIVHDWDAPDLFPYRAGCVRRIREATERMIDARVAGFLFKSAPALAPARPPNESILPMGGRAGARAGADLNKSWAGVDLNKTQN